MKPLFWLPSGRVEGYPRNSWFGACVRVGDRLMLDLGLSGLVDRFEREFGRGWTRRLLGLIGLTVAVICIGAVWAFLRPLVEAAVSLVTESDRAQSAVRLAAIAIMSIWVAAMFSAIAERIDASRQRRETEARYYEALEELESAQDANRREQIALADANRSRDDMQRLFMEAADICLEVLADAKDLTSDDALAERIAQKKRNLEALIDTATKTIPQRPGTPTEGSM